MAVRIAGCCNSAEGAFTATRLYPATKSQAKPADLVLYFSLCRLPTKPPEFRRSRRLRVLSLPRRQSRRTGRHGGSQRVFLFLHRFAVQTVEAAFGVGQAMLCYETVENSDHIRFF